MVIFVSRCSVARGGLNICLSADDFMADYILCVFRRLLCIAHNFVGYRFNVVACAKAELCPTVSIPDGSDSLRSVGSRPGKWSCACILRGKNMANCGLL